MFGVFQLCLESHHVVKCAKRIVLPQLHNCVRLDRGIVRVGETHWLHRAVTQGLGATFSHHFDREAAIEIGRTFPLFEFRLAAIKNRPDKGFILFLVHRAVDVVLAGAARSNLVVAGLEPADIHVDRVEMDNRRDGVEEGQRVGAGC